jgi:large subunit ribosomal protein L10
MPSKFNTDQVELLTEKISKAKAIYFTDFLGLDVSNVTRLRSEFFKSSVEYIVAKNTLIKIAAKNNKINGIDEFLSGPTALAISYGEPISPAKILKEFIKSNELPNVKGILFDGEVFPGEDFNRIAAISTREESLSKLILLFRSPLVQFMNVVKSPMVKLVNVLNNLKENKS